MRRVEFNDSEKTDKLWEDGFVVLPLLSAEKVNDLLNIFNHFHSNVPEGFYASTHINDIERRREMSEEASKIIEPELKKWVINGWLLGGAFISKSPGEKGILPLHQDWNLVDEKESRSYNLWIPLIDVNKENGSMRILPKSHRKQDTIRGPQIPPIMYSISEEVDKNMSSLNMKAGEAVLYDHALWHSSPANKTNENRIALVLGVVPKDSKFIHYQIDDDQIVEYDSSPDFLLNHNWEDAKSLLRMKKKTPSTIGQLTKDEFYRIYLGRKSEIKKSRFMSTLLNKLFK